MKYVLIGLFLLAPFLHLSAQTEGVSINATGDDPDPSSVLDIESDSKGILIPRMDSTSRKAITNPAEGLMVYDSTTTSFWYYTQTAWEEIGKGGTVQGRDANIFNIQARGNIIPGNPRGEHSVDLQTSRNSGTQVASGLNAVISGGSANRASGASAVVSGGLFNQATGDVATVAGGSNNQAAGTAATVSGGGAHSANGAYGSIGGGLLNEASGDYSTVPGGRGVVARSYGETAFGLYNEDYSPNDTASFDANDRLLVVGNGSPSSRSNALTLLKNGNLGLGTSTPDSTLHVIGQLRYEDGNQQNGYVLTSDTNGVASWKAPSRGVIQGTNGNTFNLRAQNSSSVAGDPRGEYSVDLQTRRSNSSAVASGLFAVVGGGADNTASGQQATVNGGNRNTASGASANIGGGTLNRAEGAGSVIGGGIDNLTTATNSTIPGGVGLVANYPQQTVVGFYNDSSNFSFSNPPILVVGNGNFFTNRSNALTILRNGNTGLGTSAPDASALLEMSSIEKGLLIPRMDSTNRLGIANPAEGLMVYDSTTNSFWYYTQTVWQEIGKGGTVQGRGVNTYNLQLQNEPLRGNTRGEYSIDLQALKFSPQEIASGQFSVIGGGLANRASGIGSLVAGGSENIATGLAASVGGGDENEARGIQSTVSGGGLNVAQGANSSVGGGLLNKAVGSYSTVIGGRANTASSYGETVLGVFNEAYTPQSTGGFFSNDRLLVVGNGTNSASRSNALTLLKNGNMGLGTSAPDASALLEMSSTEKGLLIPRMNSNNRLGIASPAEGLMVYDNSTASFWYRGAFDWQEVSSQAGTVRGTDGNTFNIRAADAGSVVGNARGESSIDFQSARNFASQVASGPFSTISGGIGSTASGDGSTVGGGQSHIATGDFVTIGGGIQDSASGDFTVIAGGLRNHASGAFAAIGGGRENQASGAATTIPGGISLLAPSFGETVIGYFNEPYVPVSPTSPQALDRLFVVGNGASPSSRSNALTLLKNGNLGLGTSTPDTTLHVVGQIRYEDGNQQNGYVLTSDANGSASWQAATGGGIWDRTAPNGVTYTLNAGHVVDGVHSLVAGDNNEVDADYTFVAGRSNRVFASQSAVLGGGHFVSPTAISSYVFGTTDTATGGVSFVFGQDNRSDASFSLNVGDGNKLTSGATWSTAIGQNNRVSNAYSFALGSNLVAPAVNETVLGAYNELYTPASNGWNANDRLFSIGNGQSNANRRNALTLLKNGRLGLGIARPANTLHLVGNQPSTQGVVTIQNTNQSGFAGTYYNDYNGVRRGYTGWINSTATNLLGPGTFQIVAGGARLFLNPANGNIGIGTATPTRGRLEINGATSYQIPNQIGFLNNNAPNNVGSSTPQNASLYSLYATERVAAESFNAHSDSRIKDIQGISNSETDLSTLMQIEVTDYRLRDSIAKGNRSIKKVIAQQVAEVYPQAVNTDLTEVVPDIYQRAEVQNGWIMLATDLKTGERVKVITEGSSEVHEVTAVEADRFQVSLLKTVNRELLSEAKSRKAGKTVFVYGREVNDFHTVDYEAISMLNVSATQEQQRRIELLEKENEALKASQDETLQLVQLLAERLQLLEEKNHDPKAPVTARR